MILTATTHHAPITKTGTAGATDQLLNPRHRDTLRMLAVVSDGDLHDLDPARARSDRPGRP